jgi:hypothetical protein
LGISLLWRILFYGWSASEIYLAVATHTRKSGGKKQDRGSQLVMWGAIVSAITVAEWIGSVAPATMLGRAHWLKLAAVVVLVAGLTVR